MGCPTTLLGEPDGHPFTILGEPNGHLSTLREQLGAQLLS
jgi:hypothetical protein